MAVASEGLMRILLVEDSERLQWSVGEGLRRSGYAVDVTGSGSEGLHLAVGTEYDVIVLDLMLPGLDGLSLLRRLRAQRINTHVLILTARDAVEDRVLGLRCGADDYLVKPFALDELLARVEALVRRQHVAKNPVMTLGPLSLDTARRLVFIRGTAVALAPREYALLEYLALRQGQVVTRSEIETHIYDQHVEPMSNVVDAAIYALRRKLDAPGAPSLIKTRRGMGYILEAGSA